MPRSVHRSASSLCPSVAVVKSRVIFFLRRMPDFCFGAADSCLCRARGGAPGRARRHGVRGGSLRCLPSSVFCRPQIWEGKPPEKTRSPGRARGLRDARRTAFLRGRRGEGRLQSRDSLFILRCFKEQSCSHGAAGPPAPAIPGAASGLPIPAQAGCRKVLQGRPAQAASGGCDISEEQVLTKESERELSRP